VPFIELEPPRRQRPQPRRRKTRRWVTIQERAARTFITLGGLGTILAVGLIFVFLVGVVMPIFRSAGATARDDRSAATGAGVLHTAVGEELLLAWSYHESGEFSVHSLVTGEPLVSHHPFGEAPPTGSSFALATPDCVFGFADGSVRIGRASLETRFLSGEEQAAAPAAVQALERGETTAFEGGVVQRTSIGQLRTVALSVELEDPIATGEASPIVRLDHCVTPTGIVFVVLHENAALRVYKTYEQENWMTGEVQTKVTATELPYEPDPARGIPRHLAISALGHDVYTVWPDGRARHFDLRDFASPRLLETVQLTEDGGPVTALGFLNGKTTLLVGEASGQAWGWFPVEELGTGERRLRRVHDYGRTGSPATAFGASPRSRVFAIGHADRELRVFYATTRELLTATRAAIDVREVAFAPKEDGLLVRGTDGVQLFQLDLGYPDASLAALFEPLWYEGYQAPSHVWQSSAGTDDNEPKLGLWPLVFGTIKGTFYSMLFGGPLALLAAVFTSEFLASRLRASIKATVELMASLPSVVLGFVAAFVIGPFVRDVLVEILVGVLTIPLAILAGAFLWQLLPHKAALRMAGWPRFLAIGAAIPLGILLAFALGPPAENLLFGGDVFLWLDGQQGRALGGWFYLSLPLGGLTAALVSARWIGPILRSRAIDWERAQVARVDLIKFAAIAGAAILIALAAAVGLDLSGLDPRGSIFGGYDSRNSLIVGVVMGFAIIPIIYTLAEDALSDVPAHLREASLGAGATRWQTATRIVIPTATSGLFSALMIGLGRAVGETMIVLMAVGSTPILEWNVFNGFRTLSANLATELPEAVEGSAHYRTLFFAGLVLFALTFVLNTVAELVRRQFRSRTQAL